MGTRSQLECNNFCWIPSATSTPLKPSKTKFNNVRRDPSNLSTYYKNIIDVRNKQRLEHKVPSASKVKKNKYPFYFDLSSSDDDEKLNERNKAPGITINSQNILKKNSIKINQVNSKITLMNQGKVAKVLSKSKKKGKASVDSSESNISLSDNCLNNNCQARITTDKSIASGNSSFRLNSSSLDEERIVHKEESQNLLKERNKENSPNKSKATEENKISKEAFNLSNGSNVENQNVGQSSSFKKLTGNLDFPKVNDKLNEAAISQSRENLILKDVNSSFKQSKNLSKANKKLHRDNKIVSSKRKGRKISDVTSPSKRRKRKEYEKPSKVDNEFAENHFNSMLKMRNEVKNLSHQLFSDSKEQELINTLDLTSVEIDFKAPALDSCEKKPRNSSFTTKTTLSKPSPDVSTSIQQYEEQKRPTRQRRVPKEFWLPPEGDSGDHNCKTVRQKQNNINDSSRIDSTSDKSFKSKNKPGNKKVERRLETNRSRVEKEPVKFVEERKSGEDCAAGNPSSSSIAGLFLQLNQLPFVEESQPGCLATECLSLRNFKCGVLKVTSKSQLSSRTMYENSYFGGIVMRGDLKMKIGDKQKDIKEGDMVFVPPLTEWSATNTCGSEAVMYYWCGRFKT